MYDALTRQITRRLSLNLRRPLAVAAPLGRQFLDGLLNLRADDAAGSAPNLPTGSAESAAVAASASNLAGWGLRNPRAARNALAGSARPLAARAGSASATLAAAPVPSSAMGTQHLGAGGSPAAAVQRPAARAARCTVDPIDARRTVISGRMSEVCDALDRLIALQAAQSTQGTRLAI